MSTPDLSEMESNAQKDLNEMTSKITRLQNDIKVVSISKNTFLFQKIFIVKK